METLIKVYLNNNLTRTKMHYNLKELNDRITLVKEVLRLVEDGVTHQDIMKRLGLDSKDNSIITRICKENGVSSRQLRTKLYEGIKAEKSAKRQQEIDNRRKQREEKSHAKILEIANMYIDGYSTSEIADKFKCSHQNVCFLLQKEYGKDWKELLKSRRETLERYPWRKKSYRVPVPCVLTVPSQEW